MSVDLCVFLFDSDLPTRESWQQAIRQAGHDFVFDEFSPLDHVGFLPTKLAEKDCGFEYSCEPIDASSDEDIGEIAGNRTHVVTFTLHGSTLDLQAAEIAAVALAKLANGVFYDPQSGSHAIGSEVDDLLAAERKAQLQWKQSEAERKWANTTKRRCSQCNAPCPEYRGNCWVCGFALGKVPG